MTSKKPLQHRVHHLLEMGTFGGYWSGFFQFFMVALILANVIAVSLETVPSIFKAYQSHFEYFELFTITIFIFEYALRLWVAPLQEEYCLYSAYKARMKYIFSPLAVIDLLAIIPFFLPAVMGIDLRHLRIFRLVKFLKLLRYSPALSSMWRVIYGERHVLFAALVIMFGMVMISSSIMYVIEGPVQPDKFGTIPDAAWWSLATLTTVGYGDVVPISAAGKAVGGVMMIFGLGFYALPIGIIASGFSEEIHRREFYVPSAIIAKAVLFKDMPSDVRDEMASRFKSITVTAGTVLTHRRDDQNGIYLILSGQLSVFYRHRSLSLEAGDLIGEYGVINEHGIQPAIVARKASHLLWLDGSDTHVLLSMWPEFSEELLSLIKKRHMDFVEDGLLSVEESQEIISDLEMKIP